MPGHDIITVGGSAGAVEAIRELASGLAESLSAAVFVVIHMAEDYPSVLAQILNRRSRLPAAASLSEAA